MGKVDGDVAPRRGSPRSETIPARARLVAHTRREAFVGIFVVAGAALGLSWCMARPGDRAEAMTAMALALGATSLLAWQFARRSTRVVERLFDHEDQVMMAAVHEIMSPLSRLVASVDRGLSGADEPRAALATASEHAECLSSLIGDLVEAARVMTGAIPLADEVVRLDDLVATVPARMTGRASVALDAAPTTTVGSPRLLQLGVGNLVRNAAEHAYGHGPGTIGVRTDDQGVVVTDDGPGMDEDLLSQLSQKAGTGRGRDDARFGLSLTAWVAEVHGGALQLRNRPTGGLEARLALPVQPAGASERPADYVSGRR